MTSTRKILKIGTNTLGNKTFLIHATAGEEAAGAGVRMTDEKWGCISQSSSQEYGRWYKTEQEALARFNEVTGKVALT